MIADAKINLIGLLSMIVPGPLTKLSAVCSKRRPWVLGGQEDDTKKHLQFAETCPGECIHYK